MWILDCDGNALSNKRIWLRPGETFVLGRSSVGKPRERIVNLTSKSVSRKHLTILIDPVKAGDGLLVHRKTQVTLKNESRVGTILDGGDKFIGETKTLSSNSHTFKLGGLDQLFRIRWQPIVLSISIKGKEDKARSEALATYQKRLEALDIKTVHSYIIDRTTHAIDKRNTPRGLQALINGKYIVTEEYIDAIVDAAASPGPAGDGVTPLPSPLENDFEINWPDAMKFLPEAGAKEKNPRESHFYAPDPARLSIFEGFTFIFGDAKQYDQLQAPITNGGAKCLLYQVEAGKTSAMEYAQRVRDAAGVKGLVDDGDPEKGVVLVRFRLGPENATWVVEFLQDVDQELEQRSIEQNEFLDVVLTKNTQGLRQPLRDESTQGIRAPPCTAVTPHGQTQASESRTQLKRPAPASPQRKDSGSLEAENRDVENTSASPPKKRIRRTVTQSRFKGFDDFDESSLPRRRHFSDVEQSNDEGADDAPTSHQPERDQSNLQSQSLFVDDSQPARRSASPRMINNKRKMAPPQNLPDEEDMLDDMLPAARALKKRRLEKGNEYLSPPPSPSAPVQPLHKKEKKQVDIRSEARHHAEAIDKRDSLLNSHLRQLPDGYGEEDNEDVSQLRNLAIVEDMIVLPRDKRTRRTYRATTSQQEDNDNHGQLNGDERWNPAWNGRRNFKRFRRAGQAPVNRGHRVMVGLEEVKRKDYGIGDAYWLESPERSRSRSERNHDSGSRSQRQQAEEIEDEDDNELEEIEPDLGPGESLVSTRTQKTFGSVTSEGPASRGSKSQQPAPRKQRQTRLTNRMIEQDEESTDEDELKFKFRKKTAT